MISSRLYSKHLEIFTGKKSWRDVSDSKRMALELLGWTQEKWDNSAPPPFIPWGKLTSEQKSAVQYGLNLSEREYQSVLSRSDRAAMATPRKKTKSSVAASATSYAWGAFKTIAPLVSLMSKSHPAAHMAATAMQQLPTILDRLADKVRVDAGVETILYLDDSGSMSDKLVQGQSVLDAMSHTLQKNARIVKFGTMPTVLASREESCWSTSLTLWGWNATSGRTYMWKMIEDDVLGRYIPGTGKLRIVVITDGYDTESPGSYRGMSGMNPMMRTLLGHGFDVEFHIVILKDSQGGPSVANIKQYEKLAEATGGSCLALTGSCSRNRPAYKQFISRLEESSLVDEYAKAQRAQRQSKYIGDAKKKKDNTLDWLNMLPDSSEGK